MIWYFALKNPNRLSKFVRSHDFYFFVIGQVGSAQARLNDL